MGLLRVYDRIIPCCNFQTIQMKTLRQEVAFNNVGLDPTCRITGSFLLRHALPVTVLCEARMTMKPLALGRKRES